MSDSKLGIAVELSAIDRMTAVIQKATSASVAKLHAFSEKANKISEKASQVGRNAAIGAAALAAPIIFATNKAIEFEDQMASVAKVAGFKVGDQAFRTASHQALELSKKIGMAAVQSAGLMENLASGGVETKKLYEIGLLAGKMGVAFDMSGVEAGEAFIKMKNGMGATYQQTKLVTDAINKLSDGTASKAREIVQFMAAGGAGVSNVLKINGKDVAAFGATLISMGKSGAEAATIMEKVQNGILLKKGYSDISKQAGGGTAGILAVLQKGAAASNPMEFFKDFGLLAPSIAQLAMTMTKPKGLVEALGMVGKEGDFSGSVLAEFAAKSATTKVKLEQAKAAFEAAAIGAGTAFLPVVVRLLNAVTPLIEKVSKWIQNNQGLTVTIMKVMAGGAVLLGGISAISFAFSGVMKVVSATSTTFAFFTGGAGKAGAAGLKTGAFLMKAGGMIGSMFKTIGLAVRAFTIVLMANPIILIITAIVAVIAAAAYFIYKYWDQIKAFFVKVWAQIKIIFWKVVAWIKEWGILFIGPVGFIIKYWDKIVVFFKTMPAKMYAAGKSIIQGLWEGIKSMAMKPIEAITRIADTIKDKFQKIMDINSPSKVFMKMGKGITVGAAMGIVGALPVAASATASLSKTIVQPVSGSRSATKPASAKGGNSYTFVIHAQGAAPGVEQNIRKMLWDNAKEIARIVKDQDNKNKRTEF